jgi:ribonuclease Z
MNSSFHPRLVNGPLGDPALYIEMKFAGRAVLFDLGEIQSLSPRQLLKISHVFISHTHMDHFIGFDHLLRILLGRNKKVHFFGPPNFLNQLENKLAAYSWNLIESYPYSLDLSVTEIHPDHLITAQIQSSLAFKMESDKKTKPFDGIVHEEWSFLVRAAFLDHKIPCLSFTLEEKAHLNIIKTELDRMGLTKGPWLKNLKEAVWKKEKDDFLLQVPVFRDGRLEEQPHPLGALRNRILKITPGQKIGYVVDTIYNRQTREAIRNLVFGANQLFIEAAFLEEDGGRAREKNHLTARQAGILAGEAGVKRMFPFHISPKYSHDLEQVMEEAYSAFRQTSKKKKLSMDRESAALKGVGHRDGGPDV